MELKTARLTLLIDPDKKAAFERLCAQQDRTASQVVRQLIRDYLAQHGVEYKPAGPSARAPVAPRPRTAAAPQTEPKRAGRTASAPRTGPRRG